MIIKNYKPLIKERLDELQEVNPNLSFAQMIYSLLRPKMLGRELDLKGLGNLCSIEDKEVYEALGRVIRYEEIDLQTED